MALLWVLQMISRITREQEWACLDAATEKIKRRGFEPNHKSRVERDMTFMDFVAQTAEAYAAEWAVANYFKLPYQPSQSETKERADVGERIEVKWSRHPAGNLWIGHSDRADDVAVLVAGRTPLFSILGWIPVSIAKRDKYRHSTQDKWIVSQINLQPIETLERSNFANAIRTMSNV
jgi:hypothetical protein